MEIPSWLWFRVFRPSASTGKAQLPAALRRMLAAPGPYLLHVVLPAPNQVYPLMEPGTTPQDMVWRETSPGSGARLRP